MAREDTEFYDSIKWIVDTYLHKPGFKVKRSSKDKMDLSSELIPQVYYGHYQDHRYHTLLCIEPKTLRIFKKWFNLSR